MAAAVAAAAAAVAVLAVVTSGVLLGGNWAVVYTPSPSYSAEAPPAFQSPATYAGAAATSTVALRVVLLLYIGDGDDRAARL